MRIPIWLLVLSCLTCTQAFAQTEEQATSGLVQGSYEDAQGGRMPYLLRLPAGYDPEQRYPLVLALHGAGGRGTDNRGRGIKTGQVLRQDKSQQTYPCFVLFPQCPTQNKWVDVSWGKGSYDFSETPISDQLQQAHAILQQVIETYPVDRRRLYITGQSMGGFGTWDMILRFPDLFAAAVPICGAGDPQEAKRIAHLPIWTFHGAKDGAIPVQASRDMVAALKEAGSSIRYTEYPEVGHNAWDPACAEPELFAWLFAQVRDDQPASAD